MRRLLTAKEVAEFLAVKPVTVYAWAKQRKIPHVVLSIGNGPERAKECIRFKQRDIEEMVEKQTRPSNGFSKWDKR
jgi:excisionase family DNA binding protein